MNHLTITKVLSFALILFLMPLFSSAGSDGEQNAGIQFHNGSWKEVLEKAKKENKLIFVDAYAVWCGPCKWMDANVFPQREVGDFYNSKFINFKIDAERGEGRTFSQDYRVTAFPTFLFINPEGEVVHRTMGAKPPNVLIEEGRRALQIGAASR